MLTAAVLVYFLIVVAVLALVFLPATRARATAVACRIGSRGRGAVAGVIAQSPRGVAHGRERAAAVARAGAAWVAGHVAWIAVALATLALPPLLAWWLQDGQAVEGYDHTVSRPVNEHVAALLRGEQLVAPSPLPPALFATPEVEAARPLIRDASRQWELLDADFRQRLLVVFQLMRERHGYEMVLLEGYRSPERQARLAAIGPHVTGAAAWQSYHQYGLAADSAFRRDGKVVIAETDPWAMRGYALFGSVAESAGLVWGGGWRLKDLGHVELRRPGVLGRREVALGGRPVGTGKPTRHGAYRVAAVERTVAADRLPSVADIDFVTFARSVSIGARSSGRDSLPTRRSTGHRRGREDDTAMPWRLGAEGNGSRTHPAARGAAHRV